MIISTPEPAAAEGAVAAMYEDDLDGFGMVFAHTRAMALNPDAYAAFEALIHAIVPSIGMRTYELATLAAAAAVGSPHCLLAHGYKTVHAGILDEEQLERVARGAGDEDLTPQDRAVMRYAARVSTDAAGMGDADSAELRAVGFSDRQIVDITLAAAARNMLSRTLLALAVPTEDVPGLSPRLADALLSPLTT